MSLKSQDSIGTSGSICGDNISIASSNRRTSGSIASSSKAPNQHLSASHHVSISSANGSTGQKVGEKGSKRGSLSSSQGELLPNKIFIQ